MRHPRNLCSLQFATEKIPKKHEAYFHINPDASRVQPILPVVLEKIKIEPELIRLDEEDNDDHQSTSTVQKQKPKVIFEETVITQIVKRLKPKDCYQCEVCLETFSLLRYFRKHLATAEEQGIFKCQEYYKTNINNGYLPYKKSCIEGIANAENGQTTEKKHSQSLQRPTAVRVQTCENSKDEDDMMKSKIGNKINKQRSGSIEKPRLSSIVDNKINFQRRYKNYVEFIQAAKCAAMAVNGKNYEDSLVIPFKNQGESSTENAEVQMPVLNTPETTPTPQVTSCQECHLTCASNEQLCIHYSKHHNLPVVVLKNVDKQELYRKYKRHVESVNKNISFKCETCPGNFSSRYYLKKHTASGPCASFNFSDDTLKTSKNDISSSEIDASKSRINSCRKNILKYANKTCELRKNKCFKLSLLRKHNFSAESQFCRKCNICNRQFSSPAMLSKHQLAVHNKTKVRFNNIQQRRGKLISTSKEFHKLSAPDRFRLKCDLCGEGFSTKKYLKLHKRGAHDGFRHKCEICPKDFPLLVSLKKHKLNVHYGVRHRCKLCPKTFSQMGHLNRHKQIEHYGVRHNCNLCPKTFTQLGHLNKHKRTVHDGVRYKCKSCPRTFTYMENLKRHKLSVHDGVRHKCELCSKTFTQLRNLNQHKQTVHDGFRHKCESCPKTFSYLKVLYQHKRTAHNRVRYTCDICHKKFNSSNHLKRHKIMIHHV